MYNKIASMNRLVNQGLNVHRFYIPETYAEFCNITEKLNKCTIRTDHAIKTEDLPFYIYDVDFEGKMKGLGIWKDSEECDYKLIISDGIKYDPIQEYNMVVKFDKNGDFIFEASELKIPLRHMYRHPLLSCSGNLTDGVSEWNIINQKYGINKVHIKDDLLELYNYGIFNKWLEVTKYPQPVGMQNKNIVFWQVV
jgi:hypothetical protein